MILIRGNFTKVASLFWAGYDGDDDEEKLPRYELSAAAAKQWMRERRLRDMNTKTDAPTPVARPPKRSHLRMDLDDLSTVIATSDLDLHIVRLLSLHPDLKVRFRNHDIASLDDVTKQALLSDMNDVLGVRSLKKHKS